MKIIFIILSLLLSGYFDSQAFVFGHKAFEKGKITPQFVIFSLLGFLGGAIFYLLALWLKRGLIELPALVEFLCWLLVAYVGILIANPQTLKWPLIDHLAVVLTLVSVIFLAYRHGE